MCPPEDIAEELVRNRWAEIKDELALIGVVVRPEDVFETPEAEGGTVRIRHKHRVVIEVAKDVPDLLDGRVDLEISETYSYNDIRADSTKPLVLSKYSYQFSYMPEVVIESRTLQGSGRGHWGDLLLTQRRNYRFDGEEKTGWDAKTLKYRNEHFVHHFHPGAGDYMRWPIREKPSVLSIACYILFSFRYHDWFRFAQADEDVLAASRVLLPHVATA